jgi:dipeptidyl aminopeptidase/acylaminoacyl peptidase
MHTTVLAKFFSRVIFFILFVQLLCIGESQELLSGPPANQRPPLRPITVADSIRMTQLVQIPDLSSIMGGYTPAQFSPSGDSFVIVVERGNLEDDTNDYSLLLSRTGEALRGHFPTVLASFSSSSNRPGIEDVRWVNDNTIAFLAENPGEEHQIYEVDLRTKALKRLTNHSTSVISYVLDLPRNRILFSAQHPTEPLVGEDARRHGIVVSDQPLSDLISLKSQSQSERTSDIFLKPSDSDEVLVATTPIPPSSHLWISPDGAYLIVKAWVASPLPTGWTHYEDHTIKAIVRQPQSSGDLLPIFQYELVDLNSGRYRALIDAPIGHGHSEVAWSPDSSAAVVVGTFLPLQDCSANELAVRRRSRFIAEVNLRSGDIVDITDQELTLRGWDPVSDELIFQRPRRAPANDTEVTTVEYQRTASAWKQIKVENSTPNESREPEVSLRQDMNTPPKLYVKDARSPEESILLNLNPQFANLTFGRVKSVAFAALNGHIVRAGIYLPPNYTPGRKYPLVIQTHGWNAERFWMDGPFSTAFAARPLAAKGIVVLQLEEDLSHESTPTEVREETSAYEGGIRDLDHLGLIDLNRVGIIGFSRTGLSVEYALTHSDFPFRAASVSDISDSGYFRYLAELNQAIGNSADNEGINGGVPFGKGLSSWLKNSSGFNLDKVKVPLRMEVIEPTALLFEWEWFAGLRRLSKPVDLIFIPDGDHELVKPWNRMTSEQGNVDWFCFWLKGEEDPDPAKAEQYARWRRLRKLRDDGAKQVEIMSAK